MGFNCSQASLNIINNWEFIKLEKDESLKNNKQEKLKKQNPISASDKILNNQENQINQVNQVNQVNRADIELIEPKPIIVKTLEDIINNLGANCSRCKLSKSRTNIVFGEGNPNAELMFVGEGPGFEEDMQAKPFIGAAGKLLTKIIQAMGLKREDVYICNVVKCRPPGNRTPDSDEIQACWQFLEMQIEVIKPKFICTLGAVATQALLGTAESISRIRGNFYDYKKAENIKILPTFHPAYLLRSPTKKKEVWEDMQKLMQNLATV